MRRRGAAAVLAFAAVSVALPSRAGEPHAWIFTCVAPEGSSIDTNMRQFTQSMEQAAKGKLRVRTRLGGVMGDEVTTFDLLRKGKVQLWAGSLGAAAVRYPALGALELPFLFEDSAAFLRVERGLAERITHLLEPDGVGVIAGGFVGWRGISSRDKLIRKPEDLRGLRVRSQSAPMHLAMWKRLGASAQATELSDLALAFSSKLVDVFDVPPTYIFATSLAGRVRHYTRTEHIMQLGLLLTEKRAVDVVPGLRDFLRKAAGETMRRIAQGAEREESELLRQLVAAGTSVLSLEASERQAWQDALAPLAAELHALTGTSGEALVRTVTSARKRAR